MVQESRQLAGFDPIRLRPHSDVFGNLRMILNHDRTMTLQKITDAVGVSKSYICQIFAGDMGLPLWKYLNRYRVQKAKEYLQTTDLPITEIVARVGFDDPSSL